MAVQSLKVATEATVQQIATESKKYAKKVSAVTIAADTTTDTTATIYNFTQNGKNIGSVKVDKEKFIKSAVVVDIAANTVVDPSNPGTEEAPNYLEEGKYIQMTFENDTSSIYLKTTDLGMEMEEITQAEVIEMFKEDITLNWTDNRIEVVSKGQQLNSSDVVKEGWVLTVSAPVTNPDNTSESLTVIVVNDDSLPSLTLNEDSTRKQGDYTVTAEDEKRGSISFNVDYRVI